MILYIVVLVIGMAIGFVIGILMAREAIGTFGDDDEEM